MGGGGEGGEWRGLGMFNVITSLLLLLADLQAYLLSPFDTGEMSSPGRVGSHH